MAVVGIADVGMGMVQLPMAMLMGVPERAIAGVIHQILRRMIVLVMGIAAAGIVLVAMGMHQPRVAMPMAVTLLQQQHHTGGHQSSGQQQRR